MMWNLALALVTLLYWVGNVDAGSYCYYDSYNGYYYYYCYYYYSINVGGIVGAVIGGLIGLGVMITVIIVLCVCVCNKNRRQPGTIVQNPAGMTVVQTSAGGYTNQAMAYPQQLGVGQQPYGVQQGVYPQAAAYSPAAPANPAYPAYPTGSQPPPYEPQAK